MSTPEEKHADQDERGGNDIPDKVDPMDALTATESGVFVLDIKTIPAHFHLTNQPRQKFKLAPKVSAGDKIGQTGFVTRKPRSADRQPDV